MLPFPCQARQPQHSRFNRRTDSVNFSIGQTPFRAETLARRFLHIGRKFRIQEGVEQVAPDVIALPERDIVLLTIRFQALDMSSRNQKEFALGRQDRRWKPIDNLEDLIPLQHASFSGRKRITRQDDPAALDVDPC